MSKKSILFLTGTRADFGKLKSLIRAVDGDPAFDCVVFATGMHLLPKYGMTVNEIIKENFKKVFTYQNQNESQRMDLILANTIVGISEYISHHPTDLIVVHGDRVETLAGAIVGSLNNIPVAHIEGGELSGTIDEVLRHSTTKLSHIHFVSNDSAKTRLMQMGEPESSIFVIGSPDYDVMLGGTLPNWDQVLDRYDLVDDEYGILLYHPVTTELEELQDNIRHIMQSLEHSGKQFVIIYPNNDHGTDQILDEFDRVKSNPKFHFFPSIRFEFFLVLLKNARIIVGNSSAGIREAEVYGTPVINIGSRQNNRHYGSNIKNIPERDVQLEQLLLSELWGTRYPPACSFGEGNSSELFMEVLRSEAIWNQNIQKVFIDRHKGKGAK